LGFSEGARPLAGGEAADDLAGGDLRQPLGFLGIGAGQHDRLGQEIDGGGEGDWGQGSAQLLGDGGQFDVAKTEPAVGLGDRRAQPALLGHGLPQALVIGSGGIVQHAAHDGDVAAALEEPPRLAFEKFLIVGEVEIHGLPSAGLVWN